MGIPRNSYPIYPGYPGTRVGAYSKSRCTPAESLRLATAEALFAAYPPPSERSCHSLSFSSSAPRTTSRRSAAPLT
eukprot:3921908-Rhodomonas_salina.2